MPETSCKCKPTTTPAAPVVLTVAQFAERHPWPTQRALRHLIFHSHQNGFDAVIRRCGSRVLIREDAFFAWLERQSHVGNVNA